MNEVDKIFPAFIKAQAEVASISKDKQGYNFKYADLPQLTDVVRAVTVPNGLAFIQASGGVRDDKVSLHSQIIHVSGQMMSWVGECQLDDKMKSKPQCLGSTITYMRRVHIMGIFFMATEDQIDSRTEAEYRAFEKTAPRLISSSVQRLEHLVSQSSNPDKTREFILNESNSNALLTLSDTEANEWIRRLEAKKGN